MTDQASSGLPTPEAPEHPTSPAAQDLPHQNLPHQNLPHWTTFARQHDWKRASASASLTHAGPGVQGTLAALASFQEDVRAKRYAGARKALAAYARHLSEYSAAPSAGLPAAGSEAGDQLEAGEAALLQSLAPPEMLGRALEALERGTKALTPEELEPLLPEADQHPLTAAEAHNIRGVLHALREEPQTARQAFEAALEADPQHYRARMNLGNLALEGGDALTAEAHYREVLKIAPDYDGVHHNLGVALRRQGKLGDSVKAIRRGQRLGTQRTRQQDREEIEEQMRLNPRLRLVRVGAIVVFLGLLALIFLVGRPGQMKGHPASQVQSGQVQPGRTQSSQTQSSQVQPEPGQSQK